MDTKTVVIPDYDHEGDFRLVTAMLCTVLMPLMYGLMSNYMLPFVKLLWIPLAAGASVGVYALGRGVQSLWARKTGFAKPVYDRDKSLPQYVELKRTWPALLAGLAVAAVMFAVAYGLRQWNYTLRVHETERHAAGYVYETVAAVYGLLATYLPACLWFLPNELVYPYDAVLIRYGAPLAMLVVSTVFVGVPLYVALLYVVLYAVFHLIRKAKVQAYDRLVTELERQADDEAHRSRYGS